MKTSPILGLIGGIGSGKSSVAAMMARYGAHVMDADLLANELLENPEVQGEIKKSFGEDVLCANGKIDKAKLANRVFANEAERTKINAIIHPRVRSRFKEEIAIIRAQTPEKVIVFDIPLLLGSELRPLCDLLVMVRASLESRIERVKRTREWDEEELLRREACQPSIQEKEATADVFINNNGSLEDLETEVKTLFKDLGLYKSI